MRMQKEKKEVRKKQGENKKWREKDEREKYRKKKGIWETFYKRKRTK